MIVTIAIFFIAIITAFGMLAFRAWEIRTSRIQPIERESGAPEMSFRHIEKGMLYLTKHIIQTIVLSLVKWWYIVTTKTRKLVVEKWPKVHNYFRKKTVSPSLTIPPSFFQRAILESKTKIRRIKEKVKREHGEENKML